MFVAVSSACLPRLPLAEALDQFVHLEFTSLELDIRHDDPRLSPEQIVNDGQRYVALCKDTYRLDVCALYLDQGPIRESTYHEFQAICKFAKALKVVSITVPSAELGTPFNEEVEHLRRLVGIAGMEGIRVSIKNQVGRISQDPDTLRLICNHVEGLGITLDPSYFVCGPYRDVDYEPLLKYVYHTHLRDTKKDALQVRIGQGEIEYGKLVGQLAKVNYKRALCIHIDPEGADEDPASEAYQAHLGELRKLRLLLESLLI